MNVLNHKRTLSEFRFASLAILLVIGGIAHAEVGLRDPATGLAVNPPEGFVAEKATPRQKQEAAFSIRSTTGKPEAKQPDGSLCQASFAGAASNSRLSQDEINAFTRKPEWRNLAKAAIELMFNVQSVEDVAVDGVEGIGIVAVPKADSKFQDMVMYSALLETPKGRTSVVCVTGAAAAESAIPLFKSIVSGVRPPR